MIINPIKHKDGDMQEVDIVTYQPRYLPDFVRLNKQWIETYFRLESSDLHTFANADEYIIGRGGQIFFALDSNGRVIGCCALIPHPESNRHELAKMAVAPEARGKGVGQRLGEALLSYARRMGVKTIFLEGNTKLEASIALYRKLGFREVPLANNAYERCDIIMELTLKERDITIRPIVQSDQQPLAELIRSVFKEYGAPLRNSVYDDPLTEHIFDTVNTTASAAYFVLTDSDGTVCGGGGFYPTDGLPESYAEIIKFYLAPAARGKGYGSRLFKTVLEAARFAGYKHLYIESFPEFSAAVEMYRRHGFKPIDHRLGHSGHQSTSIFMVADFN